ncbi:MAG: hypothetical protein ACRD1E_12790 [Terriglobales bacterium]
MAMEAGERYTCSNSECNCQIEVTRSAEVSADANPRCCCGREMESDTREQEKVA